MVEEMEMRRTGKEGRVGKNVNGRSWVSGFGAVMVTFKWGNAEQRLLGFGIAS